MVTVIEFYGGFHEQRSPPNKIPYGLDIGL